ncbi:hypothetical protein BBO99_00004005 [Phytophthora kernoviae]|uniref:WRKY19-like zinc finger domain-containing protein n=2 Tax=Phytophthora kernoviae TaxID=325452 RepID=A0A421ES57_9STRA|nr:hypothetical protein G195_006375 [Phytophthora kernoviae 00238/432]KAG2523761.1 hypothetical protein JM16_005225 [Phytophthora kernoviae]KAG2525553.1 hypothetical protein JM18_004848 [Phytophthora kernoviae]RLM95345.1 hypothetical protein BBI17_003200 [Phytophthora kernoviae]RLN81091.1 hypothetical protein BBO99_00004005 [Phytophthora kernoviae]
MDRRRSDQHQEGGDTAAEKEAPDKKRESNAQQIKQEQKEEQEQEDNRVHEITESSSDESVDEAPATKTDTLKPVEASTAANAEEKMTDQAMVEQIRAGVYMPEPEELYATKNVADMHYLFTNDKLKEQPATLVLRSDPFCIPRVTDNHTLDVTTSASDNVTSLDSAADGAASMAGTTSVSMGYQIQQLQPLDSIAETLTNYLPARNLSTITADSRAIDEHYFDAPTAYSHANVSMGMATGNGTFNSLLSPAETPYVGLFEEEGGQQKGMQSFSSALGSISIITPTNAGAGIPAAIITPQGCAVGSSEGTPRRSSAKKPRAKNVFRPCTAPGCTKGARGKSGLCQKHGGGKRCAMLNCPKGAQGSSSLCLFHGGGYRCTADGCTTGARGTSGLCAKHGGYRKGKTSSSKRSSDTNASVAKRARTTEPSVVDS